MFSELSAQHLLQYCEDNIPRVFDYLPRPPLIPAKTSRAYLINVVFRIIKAMNSLDRGCIERLRHQALLRARNANHPDPEENRIELCAQFANIINNGYFH